MERRGRRSPLTRGPHRLIYGTCLCVPGTKMSHSSPRFHFHGPRRRDIYTYFFNTNTDAECYREPDPTPGAFSPFPSSGAPILDKSGIAFLTKSGIANKSGDNMHQQEEQKWGLRL